MQTQPKSRKFKGFASRPMAAAILLLAMLISAGLALHARRGGSPAAVEHPRTAAEWLVRADNREQTGDMNDAIRACRAALAQEPWHPAAVRKLTLLLLAQGEAATLQDWMDDLILGDARLAEQAFLLPGFSPWLEQPAFQTLYREARIQARD